jgi:ATP-dependent exoDNAse (exonuclease V) beta subunit
VYWKVFARAGIPLLVRGEIGLLATQEATDCINLLRVLARPTDDVALIGLLRSAFVGVDDTWLTRFGMETDRYKSIPSRLTDHNERSPNPQLDRHREYFETLQSRVGRDAPATILQRAIAETGYMLAVQNGPARDQRAANVNRLIELVRELQQSTPSLAILVRDLENRIAENDKETQGAPEGSFEGVELMTIHKSKGLAFKTVVIPDLGTTSRGGMFPPMICELPDEDGQLGLRLPRFDDARRGDSRPCLEGWRANAAADLRSASEEKRVLYVAYTRAIERVIMVGSCRKEASDSSWAGQLLAPLGASKFDSELPDDSDFELKWHKEVDRFPGHTAADQVQALKTALALGELSLPEEIDASLVEPLYVSAGSAIQHNHAATDFGTRLHAELEKRIRCRSHDVEFGVAILDKELERQAENGINAIGELPAAREITEFGLLTSQGKRRIDLLRAVGEGRYQIVDYKSDAIDKDELDSKAEEHRQQLVEYGEALTVLLESRGEEVRQVELFVCFTAPDGLQPAQRLVQIN